MNDQATKLLGELALTFGTTSQYLWGVLLRQAPISATIDIILFIATLLMGWILWKVQLKLTNSSSKFSYEKLEAAAGIPMLLLGAVWVMFLVAAVCSIGNIINGYLDPEYLALL